MEDGPQGMGVGADEAQAYIGQATAEADAEGITGGALTPFLLDRIVELSDGRAERANVALLESNARVAAQVALAIANPI